MRKLPQSLAYTVMLKLYSSSDHVTAATGKTVAIKISKAGAAFADPAAGASNATEVANGWYKFALGTGDTDTLGDLVVRGTATACDDCEQIGQVVSATTGGASNLDAAISSRSSLVATDVWAAATRTLSAGTNIALAKGTGITGFNDLDAAGVRTAVGLAAANLDTQLSTIAGYIDTEVAAIKAKTDQLTFTVSSQVDVNVVDWKGSAAPAMTGDAFARLGAPAGASVAADVAAVKVDTAAVKVKTDQITFTVANRVDSQVIGMQTDTLTATALASSAVAEMQSGLSTLDAAGVRAAVGLAAANVDTQLSTIAGYVDTEVAAIKAKTDQLTFTVSNQVDVNVVDWKGSAAPAMSGDAFARLGAPAGASVAADVAAVKGDTAGVKATTDQITFTVANRVDSQVIGMQTDTLTAAALASSAVTEMQTGLSTLDAAGVRTAVGLAAANLDTQLSTIAGYVDTEVAAIKAKTDQLTFTVSNQVDVNVVDWKGSAAPAMSGDAFARLGAPAGASVAADVAAVKVDTAAVKAKTDNLPVDPADASDIAAATVAIYTRIGAPAGASIAGDIAALKIDVDAVPDAAAVADAVAARTLLANITQVNGVDVTGDGSIGAPWGP